MAAVDYAVVIHYDFMEMDGFFSEYCVFVLEASMASRDGGGGESRR